jgi:hypothetical protein
MNAYGVPPAAECFHELMFVVEDLLKRIANTEDADLRRRRALVRAQIIALQDTLGVSSIDANYQRRSQR